VGSCTFIIDNFSSLVENFLDISSRERKFSTPDEKLSKTRVQRARRDERG
jgi:hypothetical protein